MDKISLNKEIAFKWISAFNVHDLEKLLSLYADDAVHFSPKLKIRKPESNGWVKGKAALREWWADAFKRLPSLHYELQNMVTDDEQVVMEYLREADDEPGMLIAEILEISGNLIQRSRVYHG